METTTSLDQESIKVESLQQRLEMAQEEKGVVMEEATRLREERDHYQGEVGPLESLTLTLTLTLLGGHATEK